MSTDIQVNKSIMKFFPHEFREFSILAELFNLQSFSEYTFRINLEVTQTFNLDRIKKADTERDEYTDKLHSFCIVLLLAYMHKNDRAKKHIYDMFERAGYKDDFETFSRQIDFVDKISTTKSNQQGGGNILLFLWSFGVIMFAIIYNYYLFTYGIKPLTDTLEKVEAVKHLFSDACEAPSEHSPIIKILARGTTKPDLLYEFERLQKCLQMPIALEREIKKIESHKQTQDLLDNFNRDLSTELIEGYTERLRLPYNEDVANSDALVIHGVNLLELNAKLITKFRDRQGKVLPDETIIKTLEELNELSEEEFMLQFQQSENAHAAAPTPAPEKVPTPKPSWENTKELVGDIMAVAKSAAENTHIVGGLSPQRAFYRTLHDSLKKFQRTLEAGRIRAGWTATDTLEHLQRLVEDVIDLPSTLMYFTAINGAALTSFFVLIGIFLRSKSVKAPVVEDVAAIVDAEDDAVDADVPVVEDVPYDHTKFQLGERSSLRQAEKDSLLGPDRDTSYGVTSLTEKFHKLGPLSTEKEAEKEVEGTGGRRRKRKTIRKQKSKTRKHKRHNKRRQTKAKKGRRRLTRKY